MEKNQDNHFPDGPETFRVFSDTIFLAINRILYVNKLEKYMKILFLPLYIVPNLFGP